MDMSLAVFLSWPLAVAIDLVTLVLPHDDLDVPDFHGRALTGVARVRLAVATAVALGDWAVLRQTALSLSALDEPFFLH